MPALADDDLAPTASGRVTTLPGLLRVLGVEDAPLERQRRAVREALALPGLEPLAETLRPELEEAGLLTA